MSMSKFISEWFKDYKDKCSGCRKVKDCLCDDSKTCYDFERSSNCLLCIQGALVSAVEDYERVNRVDSNSLKDVIVNLKDGEITRPIRILNYFIDKLERLS